MSFYRLVLPVMLICAFAGKARAQQIAIHTNTLTDLVAAPNLGVEFVVGNRASLNFDITGSPKLFYVKPWKFIAFQPEFRYWLNGRALHKLYVGVGAAFALYDFDMKMRTRTGTAAGVGVTFGYAFRLSHHWTLTASAGCGLMGYWQKEYYVNDDYNEYSIDGRAKLNSKGVCFLPTNVGVTISYLIK